LWWRNSRGHPNLLLRWLLHELLLLLGRRNTRSHPCLLWRWLLTKRLWWGRLVKLTGRRSRLELLALLVKLLLLWWWRLI